jgi:cell division protein FtsQ
MITRARLATTARWGAALIVLACVLTVPLWAPRLLRRMAYFHVRRLEIVGTHYLAPRDIVAALHVDTTVSVWDATQPLEHRLELLPELAHADVRRKLPGTLVVTVTERIPVALVPESRGMRPYDADGRPLPLDPARVPIDAPVIAQRDTALLRLLGSMKSVMPEFYQTVSAVRPQDSDAWRFEFTSIPVLAMRDVTLDRLADVLPVERDLATRQLRAAELDLRYRDQVIARLP